MYSRITKSELSANDERRLELLCAVYAYRLYAMCRQNDFSSFKAGDVSFTSPARKADNAEKLWLEQLAKCDDLIKKDGFLFGRVVT